MGTDTPALAIMMSRPPCRSTVCFTMSWICARLLTSPVITLTGKSLFHAFRDLQVERKPSHPFTRLESMIGQISYHQSCVCMALLR